MHTEDLKLVKTLLKGDQSQFLAFYNAYFPRVYRFCRTRLNDTESCNDVVQQTMTNAMKALATYRGEASLLTWLCQIARNEIKAWYRRNQHHRELTDSLDERPELLAALESRADDLTQDATDALVQTSLDQLPSSYGKVLELKYIEGLSVNEIADRMTLGEVAVQSLLARARKAFRDVFSDLQKSFAAGNRG